MANMFDVFFAIICRCDSRQRHDSRQPEPPLTIRVNARTPSSQNAAFQEEAGRSFLCETLASAVSSRSKTKGAEKALHGTSQRLSYHSLP